MKRSIPLRKGLSLGIVLALSAVLLAACASVPAPAGDNAMLLGQLSLSASGTGTSPLGALGTVNTTVFTRAVLKIKEVSTGATHELSSYGPEDLFVLPNLKPGRYEIMRIWGQVRTPNSVVTLKTAYTKAPTFTVAPDRLVNLGVIGWKFAYDLSSTSFMANGKVTFEKDYSSVAARFSQLHPVSGWSEKAASTPQIESAGTAAKSSVWALPPRGGFSTTIIP